MKRKAYSDLMKWKEKEGHKPLVVTGARQVGKTYLIDYFARKNYPHYIYVDFSSMVLMRKAFESNLDVDNVLSLMNLYSDKRLDFVPGKTLIFFDEVQECPSVRTALKQFSLDGRFDVIASGSLLGVLNRRNSSIFYPVGYEEQYELRSLDVEEFLWALDVPEDAIGMVCRSIRDKRPLGESLLSRFLQLFREYMVVGGMPEAVVEYVKTRNVFDVNEIHRMILRTSYADMSRYVDSPKEQTLVRACFNSIPGQLSQTNKKFIFSYVDENDGGDGSNATADKYRFALWWIHDAGYANFCMQISEPVVPIEAKVRQDAFKVYLYDTGILMTLYGVDSRIALASEDYSVNMGAVAENIVAECIVKSGFPLRYYVKSNGTDRMELDFIVECGGVNVIEVKSGKNRHSASLRKVSNMYPINRRIMFDITDIRVDEQGIEHYPLFAAAFIRDVLGM